MANVEHPMYRMIQRLLADAPKLKEGDTPAIVAHVALKGHHTVHYGSLSEEPFTGLMRILTTGEITDPGQRTPRLALFETFFDVEDIASITVEREVEAARPTSSIITAS